LVLATSIQIYILEPLSYDAGANVSLFRLLRFLRIVRVFRMVRVMRMFTEARILILTFVSSLRTLAWSLIFMFFIIVMMALFLSFLLHDYIMQPTNDYEKRAWVFRYYGSAARSTYTLFEATMSGCWPEYFRPLVEEISIWYVIFVALYVVFVVFAVTRIVFALFLKETLHVAGNDAETQASEQAKKKAACIDKLRAVFHAVDVSKDGSLDRDEFARVCKNSDVLVYLKMLELDVANADALFFLLDADKDGVIKFEEFLQGVMRLKGQARSMDVVGLMRAQDQLLVVVQQLADQVHELHVSAFGGILMSVES